MKSISFYARMLLLPLIICTSVSAEVIRIGAAISLKEAMEQIASDYQATSTDKIELTFGSSGQLTTQIKNGAEIDVFISASQTQVDDLVAGGMVDLQTRRVIAGNTLVLVVPAEIKNGPRSFEDLTATTVSRVSIGEPKTVPAGEYAMEVLTHLKLADKLKEKLIFGANVRQVLSYVERGEVTAGLVYATDARQSGDKVKVVATAPADSHEPIIYPAVVIKTTKKPAAAKKLLDFLTSAKAKAALKAEGFLVEGVGTTQPTTQPTTRASSRPAP